MGYLLERLHNGLYHLVGSNNKQIKESMLTRYHILHQPKQPDMSILFSETTGQLKENNLVFSYDNKELCLELIESNDGYRIEIPVDETVRMFGLGDVDRNSVQKRGLKTELWIKTVSAYGPIPFLVTSAGWGIFLNSTYKILCDLDSTGNGLVSFTVTKGTPDFYIFLAPTIKNIINLFTDLTGKPLLLPKSAYGFTFCCNEEEGAKDLLNNCANFRREGFPMDYLGLEPGWMSENYDFTTKKKWHPERFYLPIWQPEDYSGEWSFFFNLREMGCKLSLWLCCDYDILWEEEKMSLDKKAYDFDDANIRDEHLGYDTMMDKLTVPGEPWFEHLKKFVRQGVSAFKLDGANQLLEHPDRLWAGKYFDDEVHNVYCVLLAKQMKEGFCAETGKRAMIYTPDAWAGTQQYAATWAGDTGGTQKTLVSLMNYAMCGHSNTSCDMAMTDLSRMHYGFLIAWSQVNGWRNWHHPWLLGPRLLQASRDYSRLRSSLFPYIYSFAHMAANSGLAIVRPLLLMYEETSRFDDVDNMYMLGDFLLVGAFNMHLSLPDGKWYDYFSQNVYENDCDYLCPPNKGGALLVKAGSIIVTQEPMLYLEEKLPEKYYVALYPGEACSFDLIEDDGCTEEYLNGAKTVTNMQLSAYNGSELSFRLNKRQGGFNNMPAITDFDITLHHTDHPSSLLCNGKNINFNYDAEQRKTFFTIPAAIHESETVEIQIVCKP